MKKSRIGLVMVLAMVIGCTGTALASETTSNNVE